MKREAAIPRERKEKQLSCPPVFRLHCRPARSLLSPLAADAACRGREGDPGRPQGGRSARAGADIAPATGRGRFAPMPHATRGGRGTAQFKRQISRSRTKGSTGCRGESVSFLKGNTLTAAGADVRAQAQGKTALFPQCAGSATSDQGAGPRPLSPHAPRRAGDQLPTPGSSRKPRKREGKKKKLFAGQRPRGTERHRRNTPGHFNFEKGETRGGAQRRLSPCCRIPGRQQACPRPQPRLESAM